MLSALNQIYSHILQVECLFHLSKNVFRCQPDIELQQTYFMDLLFRGNICLIPVLSFVPVQNILAFNELCNNCGIDELPVVILKLIILGSCERVTLVAIIPSRVVEYA